jgi:hypothetical protein
MGLTADRLEFLRRLTVVSFPDNGSRSSAERQLAGAVPALLEALAACRVAIVYARDRRGGAFDFDTWIRLVESALDKGQLPPHAFEEAQGEALRLREALTNVQKERDALKAECHGRRYDPNLVKENQQLRDELAEVDSVIGDYDWAAVAEDAHGTDFAAPLEKVARIEKARKEARK